MGLTLVINRNRGRDKGNYCRTSQLLLILLRYYAVGFISFCDVGQLGLTVCKAIMNYCPILLLVLKNNSQKSIVVSDIQV